MINFYNKYLKIKEARQEAYNAAFKFVVIAFNKEEANKQYEEAIKKYNLQDKTIIYIGCGVYTTEEGLAAMREASRKANEEIKTQVLTDKNELINAIRYEMNNQEYIYNDDEQQLFENFNLTPEEVKNSDFFKECFIEARNQYFDRVN